MTNDHDQIGRRRQDWIAAVNARSVDEYVELLTDDVVWFPPKEPAFQGKAAFTSWLRPFFESFSYDFTVTKPVVVLAGTWAVERGTFYSVMSSLSDGRMLQHGGRYMIIWRKDADGLWRIERYIDETDAHDDANDA